MSRSSVDSGTWAPGMAYLRTGSGRPLLYLPGLALRHGAPRGADRRAAVPAGSGLTMLLPTASGWSRGDRDYTCVLTTPVVRTALVG